MTALAARHRYALVSALTWLPTALGIAPMVLLMQVRGLGLAEVGLVFAVYGVGVAALELPTGGFADVIGRRTVLAASATVGIAALAWMAFATSLWQFVAVSVLKAIARALSSGPAEAWYVDAAHMAGADERELRRGLSHGSVAGSAALAIGTLAGGGLPVLASWLVSLPDGAVLVPLSVPILVGAAASVLLLVVALTAMTEPARPRPPRLTEVLRDVPLTIGRGIRLGVRDGVLTRVLLTAVTLGIALNAIELLTPGRLADLTGDPETASSAYAVVAALGFAADAVGAGIGPRVASLLSRYSPERAPARTVIAGAALSAVSLGGLAASASLDGALGIVAAGAAYTGMFTGIGIASPLRSELLHGRVAATERATVLSVDSLMLQSGGTVGAVALGAVADQWSVGVAWWIAAAATLSGATLYLSRSVRAPAPGAHPVSAGPVPVSSVSGDTAPRDAAPIAASPALAGDAVASGVDVHPTGT